MENGNCPICIEIKHFHPVYFGLIISNYSNYTVAGVVENMMAASVAYLVLRGVLMMTGEEQAP